MKLTDCQSLKKSKVQGLRSRVREPDQHEVKCGKFYLLLRMNVGLWTLDLGQYPRVSLQKYIVSY